MERGVFMAGKEPPRGNFTMTSRRRFFAGLAGIAVAAATQCFGTVEGPKEAAKRVLEKISESYQNAQYEDVIYFHPSVINRLNPSSPMWSVPSNPISTEIRYDFVGGQWVKRPSPAAIQEG